jgi:GNAT superfamily N-acetyltransferase
MLTSPSKFRNLSTGQALNGGFMADMLQDLQDEAAVIQAIENNIAEFLLAMGKVGDGEEKHSADITWTIGGSPIDYHNAVVHANLSPENADAAIGEVVERLTAHNVSGTWHLSPSMKPDDLNVRLEAQGFVNGGDEPGMAAYLPMLNESPTWHDFRVTRVGDAETLAIWEKKLAAGFGEGEREAKWVAEIYGKIGFDDANWRHFLGWLGDEPVATTSMYLGAGVAGIYFVFTVPQARRRGIGGAITAAALHHAMDMGYKVGVLGSSSLGFPVYQRLGFRQYCKFMIYEWHSDK